MSRLDPSIHPALTDSAIARLIKKRIATTLSFVQSDPELIVKLTGLQYSTVLQIRNSILTKFSSPFVTGDRQYNEVIERCAIIRSGIENLDNLLDGGFVTGNIYELCGAIASGKTQICLTTAVNICSTFPDQNVLYIDTKNDVTAHRIFNIVKNRQTRGEDDETVRNVMNRIKISHTLSATDLISLLHTLSASLRKSIGKPAPFRVIVIDSISSLFFRYLGDERSHGLFLLNNISNLLHYIAVEYHVAVILTNLVTSWTSNTNDCDDVDADGDDGESESEVQASGGGAGGGVVEERQMPLLGKYWMHVPNTRVHVKNLESSDKWLLVVMKSTSQAVGRTAQIEIGAGGAT